MLTSYSLPALKFTQIITCLKGKKDKIPFAEDLKRSNEKLNIVTPKTKHIENEVANTHILFYSIHTWALQVNGKRPQNILFKILQKRDLGSNLFIFRIYIVDQLFLEFSHDHVWQDWNGWGFME